MATSEIKTVEKLVKEVLELVKGKKETSDDSSIENINTKLDAIMVSTDGTKELAKKVDKLNTKLDKKTKDFSKEIQNAFETYNQKKLEILSETGLTQSEDVKDFVAIVTNEIIELKGKFETFNSEFTDLNINTTMATSKEIVSMKNHVLALNDSIDEIRKSVDNIKLEEKALEPVANATKDAFDSSLNAFKDSIFNVMAKIMEGIDDITAKALNNSKIMEGFENTVGEIVQNQQKNKNEIIKIINKSISDENKKLLPKIMQIVDSVSFEENAEEIKDCIAEVNSNVEVVNSNLDVINQNIETNLSTSHEILDKVGELKESANINPEIISKIKDKLDSVTNDFNVLTKGSKEDSEEYVYTLLDLESDISKVRILLDDLTHAIQNDEISNKIETISSRIQKTEDMFTAPDYQALLLQFDALNDDITSISKRTNKLILTSDDSSLKLEKNIADFQSILNKICLSVNNFDKSSIIKNISLRTENLQKMMQASMQSSNALNEAFMHLADWIDTTSTELDTIKAELKVLTDDIKGVSQDADSLSSKDLLTILKDTNKKLDDNNNKMNLIEEKLQETSDMKASIDFLVAQMQMTNKTLTENKALTKKVESMEKQIQKLLSYVEED